ncbi:MAG: type II secretion system protein GspG, partial [Acidobacteriia bacterium]|nr:type II secretion system protein GspG [Terriglobia bacterium]
GFTLIELLIVVAIIGIIAAIAIPNLLNAIDRGKQKRTMADIRSIGTAVESYAIDNNYYPTAADIGTLKAVGTAVEPIYIKTIPAQDGWRHDFYVASTTTGYTLASGGKDGGDLTGVVWGAFGGGNGGGFDSPIIFMGGQFAAWPEGVQQ